MSEESRPEPVRWHHGLLRIVAGSPEDLAGSLYGTIVVLGITTAGRSVGPTHLVELVMSTTLVLWIGHVYAHGLAESVQLGRRLDVPELRSLARREASIPLAAIAPSVALCLGAFGVLKETNAIWLAISLGLVTLAIEGFRYARLEHLGPSWTIAAVVLNVAIGLLIVSLKVFVTH